MTLFAFYCPACGESMDIALDSFELAPGTETMECPICEQKFVIVTEYKPIEEAADDTHS